MFDRLIVDDYDVFDEQEWMMIQQKRFQLRYQYDYLKESLVIDDEIVLHLILHAFEG